MAGQEETKDDARAEKAYEAAAAKTSAAPLKTDFDVKSSTDGKVGAGRTGAGKTGDAKASSAKSASSASAPLPGLPQPISKPPVSKAPISKPVAPAIAPKPAMSKGPVKAKAPKGPAVEASAVKAPVLTPVAPAVKTPAAKVAAPKPAAPAQKNSLPLPPVQTGTSAGSNAPVSQVAPVAARPDDKVAQDVAARVAAPSAASGKAAEIAEPKTNMFAGLFNPFILEEKTMDISSNFAGFQGAMTEAQAKAKAAFEKSSVAFGEAGDFAKGNVEAVIESGKIFAEGLQGMGSELVAESRTAFETFTGDIKELAAAKSPTDFFKLQGDILRKNFDSAVAYGSKNSEAALKLFSDTVAPISGRVSVAVEKARNVAA